MNITLEMVDAVMNNTGCTYQEAKTALINNNGSVGAAIQAIYSQKAGAAEHAENQNAESAAQKDKVVEKVDEITEKLKKLVKEGNVNRIIMKRNGETLLTLPVNVGIIGGVLGITAAPWAVIAGAIAAYGFDCTFEIQKNDGTTDVVE